MIRIKLNPHKKFSFVDFCKELENENNYTVNSIEEKIKLFEKEYGMESAVFIKKFGNKELPDEYDFLKWAHLYDMYKSTSTSKGGETC